ncbi:hypothetical protein AMATHDRAFT_67399 [Amanita thiersii Skay4041]|uniref:Uncharacterized protein n=1 Tax=Amanita thiersii Skay4041 TaxID=703135 RepID=A0A2A9NHA0_9AGAR|nr:hypothetical protein AMATHDRAFT_67399 [Amanita thiersii Skay4041]
MDSTITSTVNCKLRRADEDTHSFAMERIRWMMNARSRQLEFRIKMKKQSCMDIDDNVENIAS